MSEETMADYAKELEASFRTISEGDIISGTVISVDEEGAVLDLRYYTQGIIPASEFSNDPDFSLLDEIHVGDTVEGTVLKTDDGHGNILLSCKEANDVLVWDKFKSYLENSTNLKVRVKEAVNAGVIAYLEGIRGFIPASQLSLTYVEDLSEWIGKTLDVRVITADKEKEKLVLSAKVIEKELKEEEQNHKISMLVPGSILEGKVETLTAYGAFVSLGDGLSGLVHISQICDRRIKKPSEVLTIGDTVRVKVLNTNDGKISLSIKAVEDNQSADSVDSSSDYQYESAEEATTSLASLFANLKL